MILDTVVLAFVTIALPTLVELGARDGTIFSRGDGITGTTFSCDNDITGTTFSNGNDSSLYV